MTYLQRVKQIMIEYSETPYCQGDAAMAGLITLGIEIMAVIADELHEMNGYIKREDGKEE